MSDPYYDKYLKYKNKYNKLKIELDGGINSAAINRFSRGATASGSFLSRGAMATGSVLSEGAMATGSVLSKGAMATSSVLSKGSKYVAENAEKLKDNTAAVIALDTYNGAVENFIKSVEYHNNYGINKFQKDYDKLKVLKEICDKRRNKIGKEPCIEVPPVTEFNINPYRPLTNNNPTLEDDQAE